MNLSDMLATFPTQIEQLENTVTQMGEQISALTEKKEVFDNILSKMKDTAEDILDSFKEYFETENPDCVIETFGGFGTTNLTDFRILDEPGGSVILEYLGEGWDEIVTALPEAVDTLTMAMEQFDFSFDFLNKPLGLEGTYGINDMISKMTQGKNIIEANKSKFEEAVVKFTELIDKGYDW